MKSFNYIYDGAVIDNQYVIDCVLNGQTLGHIMLAVNRIRKKHMLSMLRKKDSECASEKDKDAHEFVKECLDSLGTTHEWKSLKSTEKEVIYHVHWKGEIKSFKFQVQNKTISIFIDMIKSEVSFNVDETCRSSFCSFVTSLEEYWKKWSVEDFLIAQCFNENEHKWEEKKKEVLHEVEKFIENNMVPKGYHVKYNIGDKRIAASIPLCKSNKAVFYIPFLKYEIALKEMAMHIDELKELSDTIPLSFKITSGTDKTT